MELEDLNKLEEKVRNLVNSLKTAKEENQKLKAVLESQKKESASSNQERLKIKKKVENLIQLIDSIEQ
jgi:hypothetical protein